MPPGDIVKEITVVPAAMEAPATLAPNGIDAVDGVIVSVQFDETFTTGVWKYTVIPAMEATT